MKVTNDDTIKAYDQGVKAYLEQSQQTVSGHIKNWIDAALEGLPKDSKIFEIGSGTGKDSDYVESLGYRMELTDASQGFVDFLKQKGKSAKKFNILTDEFSGTYALVFADAVLLHFTEEELKRILKKVYTALDKKGRVALTLKYGEGDFIEDKKLGENRYFHLWSPEEIESMMDAFNFKTIKIETVKDSRENKPGWILLIAEKQQ